MPPINGADVLVYVNTGTVGSPTWTKVGYQRNVQFQEQTALIDTSSKESRNRTGLPGRYSASVSLDALYVPGTADFLAVRAAMRNGALLQVKRYYAGAAVEQADAVLTALPQGFPDQAEATFSMTLEITGAWS